MRTILAGLVVCAALLAGPAACQAPFYGDDVHDQQAALIRGTVAYTEKTSLPAGSVVSVALLDVTSPREPRVISQQQQREETAMPVRFELVYDPREIDPRANYGVVATITLPGESVPTWSTPAPRPVVPMNRGDSISLLVVRVLTPPAP